MAQEKKGSLIAIDEEVANAYIKDRNGNFIYRNEKKVTFLEDIEAEVQKLNLKSGSETDLIYVGTFCSKDGLEILLDVHSSKYDIADGAILVHGDTTTNQAVFANGDRMGNYELRQFGRSYNCELWSCTSRMLMNGHYGAKDVFKEFENRNP